MDGTESPDKPFIGTTIVNKRTASTCRHPIALIAVSAVLLSILSAVLVYYMVSCGDKPQIYGRTGKLRQFLESECHILQKSFWPTIWAFGTHLQTIIPNLIRDRQPDLTFDRELVKVADGGQFSLDWYKDGKGGTERIGKREAVAVLVPGLTGGSQAEYVKSLVPGVQELGYICVAMNQRGRGGTPLLTPKLYSAAQSDDLNIALTNIRNKYPNALIVAVGFSLGGIQLTHHVVEKGSDSPIDAAVAISAMFDLLKGNESLEKWGLNSLFNRVLTKGCIKILDEESEILKTVPGLDWDEIRASKSLRDLDRSFTAKMWGFASAEDYFNASSNAGKLHQIRVPTVCVSAADDIFTPKDALPLSEVSELSHMTLIVPQRGGHIGFMDGFIPRVPFWSERFISQYLQAIMKLRNPRKELSDD